MDKNLLRLEYDKILAKLAAYTSFAVSREMAENLLPAGIAAEATERLAETDEAAAVLTLYPLFSLGGLWDIRPSLAHLQIGGVLTTEELINIAATARAARQSKQVLSELRGKYPIICGLGRELVLLKTIESAVEKAIADDGSINDNASDKLASIRRRKRQAAERIKERLDSLIKNPQTAKLLQEPIVTIRDNRYVVPVKQEFRGQVAGIVHDMSSSGATLFIEPLAVMEQNNQLQQAAREEEEEIAAIIRALSMVVNGFSAELQLNIAVLARLDFIFAKGRFSYFLEGIAPKISDSGVIRLVQARHPLIIAEKVVPIDVSIDKKIFTMIITGPNTGGKTVTLKTVGLLTLMGLAGLHIPAKDGCEISCFSKVFADIGDEQSIEQNLSTFSSHMANIVKILAHADEKSLVLLDELGAGTDPTEGAALAMAILEYLQKCHSKVIATTHYSELKAYACNNPATINASVEFDLATLSPTYRLLTGVPGKSNAFEISRRLGLKDSIVDTAASFLSQEDVQITAMLANLEDMRRDLTEQKRQLDTALAECATKDQHLREQEQLNERERAEALIEANRQAQQLVAATMDQCSDLYQQIRKQASVDVTSAQKSYQQAQIELKKLKKKAEQEQPELPIAGAAPRQVLVGEKVFLPRLNNEAVVLKQPDSDGQVQLQVGALKLKYPFSDIRLIEEDKGEKSKNFGRGRYGKIQMEKALAVKSEIDLHGMEVLEAINVLDKYIDDSFIAGARQVKIIHGRGTGALRKGIREYLQSHRLVKSYKDSEYNDGGVGATIVELDV